MRQTFVFLSDQAANLLADISVTFFGPLFEQVSVCVIEHDVKPGFHFTSTPMDR